MLNRLAQSKTFWTGISATVAAVGAHIMGEISLTAMFQLIVPALLAIFIRDGISKAQP
jgi:hypothetical protein